MVACTWQFLLARNSLHNRGAPSGHSCICTNFIPFLSSRHLYLRRFFVCCSHAIRLISTTISHPLVIPRFKTISVPQATFDTCLEYTAPPVGGWAHKKAADQAEEEPAGVTAVFAAKNFYGCLTGATAAYHGQGCYAGVG